MSIYSSKVLLSANIEYSSKRDEKEMTLEEVKKLCIEALEEIENTDEWIPLVLNKIYEKGRLDVQAPVPVTRVDSHRIYCGNCGKRIHLKIKPRYCHKCGVKIGW